MPTVSRGVFSWLFRTPAIAEDFGDRINHFWTFGLLLLLACIISWKQGYSHPISCWTPDNFTTYQSNYAHKLCWNSHVIQYPKEYQSSYSYEKANEDILPVEYPIVVEKRVSMFVYFPYSKTATRTIYQWLPLILCLQAVLFKLPYLVLYILHGVSGISFEKIRSFTNGFESLNWQERNFLCKRLAQLIYDWCVKLDCPLPLRLLAFVWLFVKILYIINIVLQLFFIDRFVRTQNLLNINSTSYTDVITGNIFESSAVEWTESAAFPRIVYCLFDIHKVKNIEKHHLQCHLPANAFNEQICVFIWIWLHFVAITTILSLIVWLVRVIVPVFRKRFIKEALVRADDIKEAELQVDDLKSFCNVIGEDGVIVLKLISANSSECLIGEIVGYMWKLRHERYEEYFEKAALYLSKKNAAQQALHDQPELSEPETDV